MFNIDYNKLLLQLIPVFMRQPIFIAFMQSLIMPVRQVYDKLLAFRTAKLYELAHTPQVFSMQNVLNDRFDSSTRRIYITDGFTKERFYIYTRIEAKSKYLKKYIYNRADYADTGVDFIVWVPTAVVLSAEDMFELFALVNNYKLAGKRYKVYRV